MNHEIQLNFEHRNSFKTIIKHQYRRLQIWLSFSVPFYPWTRTFYKKPGSQLQLLVDFITTGTEIPWFYIKYLYLDRCVYIAHPKLIIRLICTMYSVH